MIILGYDIAGRPIRSGDRVKLVGSDIRPQFLGDVHAVIGPIPGHLKYPARRSGLDPVDIIQVDTGVCVLAKSVRRLDDNTNHQPADAEFTAWLRGLGVGVLE